MFVPFNVELVIVIWLKNLVYRKRKQLPPSLSLHPLFLKGSPFFIHASWFLQGVSMQMRAIVNDFFFSFPTDLFLASPLNPNRLYGV